jgi:hypothetical protein
MVNGGYFMVYKPTNITGGPMFIGIHFFSVYQMIFGFPGWRLMTISYHMTRPGKHTKKNDGISPCFPWVNSAWWKLETHEFYDFPSSMGCHPS